MPSREEAKAFMKALEALEFRNGAGKVEVNFDKLRDLVRQDPELTVAVARSYLAMGSNEPAYLQRAQGLAYAYKAALGDDSLLLLVTSAIEAAGVPDTGLTGRVPEPQAGDKPRLIQFVVDRKTLEKGDTFALVRGFSVERAKEERRLAGLAALRARVLFTFDVRDDPRPVWKIPEARAVVAKIFAALPYFPYFLARSTEAGAFLVFWGCVADLEAVEDTGVDFAHRSVVEKLALSLAAIDDLARELGEDPAEVRRDVLSALPDSYVNWFLAEHPSFR